MAELASWIAQTALEKLASKAYEEIGLAKSVIEDLNKLERHVRFLNSMLGDAEKKQNQKQNEELKTWLVDLKDLLNDAVDVLDEFDCEVLSRQVVNDYGTFGRKVLRLCSSSNPLVFRSSIARQVKEINERFDEITKEMARFQLIRSQLNGNEEQSYLCGCERSDRMTHSFVKASEVIGRDGDKEQIISMLMSQYGCDGDDNLAVVPIVGLGGLGKTTVAQSVFNDEKVKGWFDLKLWVCVSLDFDVARLLREILESAKYAEQDPIRLSLDQLQTSVRETLGGKRFLLVLDDVWNEDRVKWLELRQFLTGGAQGSKVIVTTRSTTVCSIMTRVPPHKLQGLTEEDSLSLFFRCSFGDEKLAGQNQRLEDIGKEISKKCAGVPLALKTLGSLLYSKPEAIWVSVRDSEIWEMENDQILPALRLSYNAMSSSLKQCFAYCSTFPDDAEMASFDLILIWMALGFLQSPNGKLELEDVGKLQFEELCHRSFLQRSYDDDDYDDETDGDNLSLFSRSCKMHDLIHDLACSITESECCIVKPGKEKISNTVRNLRLFVGQNNPAIVQRLKKLRSIHVDENSPAKKDIIEYFLSMCVKQSRYLRVFDLRDLYFEVLPSSIGTLKHLRYLNLSGNESIKRLPNSICKLQSLQTLLLAGCTELEELPRDIRNLVSLRVLSITTKQTHLPEGIGRLKSLQMLIIIQCNNLGFLPLDMRNCTTLRYLEIEVCPELSTLPEGMERLTSLSKMVIRDCNQLKFPPESYKGNRLSLKEVTVIRLGGMTDLPEWLQGASHALECLSLRGCHNLVALPEWLPDLTSLKRLEILGCPKLSTLPEGMERLTSLSKMVIRYCDQLKFPPESYEGNRLSLKEVTLIGLGGMTDLPEWLQGASHTLECLSLRDCDNLVALPEWLPDLTSLKRLEILGCPELSTLPEGMECLTSLSVMVIDHCNQLKFPPESYKGNRLSLIEVTLRRLGRMTDLPEWLQGASHTLECSSLRDCDNLVALPEWLPDLTSLKRLEIEACPKLSTLPEGMERLTSLSEMEIGNCNQLKFPRESYKGNRLSLKEVTLRRLGRMTDLPEWLQGASHTLECLSLRDCDNLVALPEWLPDLTSLKRLDIEACRELSTLPEGMERLTSLSEMEIGNCNQLKFPPESYKGNRLSLKEVALRRLGRMTDLPEWLQGASHTLECLSLRDCDNLVALPEWLPDLTSLKRLQIMACPELSTLPEGMVCLNSLSEMVIGHCNQLKFPPESYKGNRLSLKEVTLRRLGRMTDLPEWLQGASHTLECLSLMGCDNLVALPEWLPDLTSLKRLEIEACPKLSTLPEGMSRLTSLTHLQFEHCSSAFRTRYICDIGEDWESIAHIPNIYIWDEGYKELGKANSPGSGLSSWP